MNARRYWSLALKITFVVTTVAVAVPALLEYLLFVYPTAETYLMSENFDAQRWRDGKRAGSWPTRLRMIDDLLATRVLEGKKKEEIVALLGPGDKTSRFTQYDMVYWLGPERGLVRIDSEWLVIKLGKDASCLAATVARD